MNTPEKFYRVSQSQLSIARFYGGATVNGVPYVYDPTTDTLTREDVVKRERGNSRRKRMPKGQQKAEDAKRVGLFDREADAP